MPQIEISDETHASLKLAARISGMSLTELVDRMVAGVAEGAPPEPVKVTSKNAGETGVTATRERTRDQASEVELHAVYLKKRVTARLRVADESVTVVSDPLPGRTYGSPSEAAEAVVRALNPSREFPQTNGRTFWIVTATGKNLRSVLGVRS